MNLLNKFSEVKKSKACATLTAFALAVLIPGAAFAAGELETGAKEQVTEIATTVGVVGVAVLAIVGAVAAVNVVMRMIKKS